MGLIANFKAKRAAKWAEIYDDRDDAEANDAYFKMHDEAMAEAEEKYKDRPANS